MDDGTIVKAEDATQSWDEILRWDGHNHVSVATGSAIARCDLHRSRKGRYWIEYMDNYMDTYSSAKYVTNAEAIIWLLANHYALPDDLAALEDEITE